MRDSLIGENICTENEIFKIQKLVKEEVLEALNFAINSPFPDPQEAFESALSADIDTSISSMGSIVHSMDLSDVEFDFSASIFSSHSAVSKVIKDVVIGDSGGNNDSAQTREDVLVKK